MKKKEIQVEENVKVVKKSNKKLIALLIVIAVVVFILSIIVPFIIVFGFAFLFSGDAEFENVNDNIVKIPGYNTTVEVVDSEYDEEEGCFVLYTKVEKGKTEEKKINKFFDIGSSLDVAYVFKDKDGYVLGTEYLYIEDFDKGDKWKQNVYYCDSYAESIDSYVVDSVNVY